MCIQKSRNGVMTSLFSQSRRRSWRIMEAGFFVGFAVNAASPGGTGGRGSISVAGRELAGSERRAGFRADVDQTLAGLEAGQRLGARQGGQRATETQHGGSIVFSYGDKTAQKKKHNKNEPLMAHTSRRPRQTPSTAIKPVFVRVRMYTCMGGRL